MDVGDVSDRGSPSERLIDQRIRNRVIEYLELASSFEEQRRYERNAPIVHVPYEVINQWEDYFGSPSRLDVDDLPGVYSPEEGEALRVVKAAWEVAAETVPENFPSLDVVQAFPEWEQLRRAALAAVEVFDRRGRMPEDREVA